MVLRHRTSAFVLGREDSLDADRTFFVFTKDFGRIEVLGKSIRKIDSKLKGGIEVFSLSNIEFIQGKNKKTLTDAVFIKKFKNVFESTNMLETAHKISQLADNFIKGQEPDEKIWDLLTDVFEKLNNYQENNRGCQLIYPYFFWNFVSMLGYGPELSNCANCSAKLNPYELYFSSKEGGVICKICYTLNRNSIKVKSGVVKVLRLIIKKDWSILSKLKIENSMQESLNEVSDNYYSYLKSNFNGYLKNT